MKRILTVCDSKHYSQSTVRFSCYLARLTKSKVVGVFPKLSGSEDLPVYMPFGNEALVGALVDSENGAEVVTSVKQFKEACGNEGVACDIVQEHDNAHKDLVAESLFADVIVLDQLSSFSPTEDKATSRLIESLIADAHCPVMIAPVSFDAIEEIIFAYDGSASAMFAIKGFTCLFPQLSDKKISVVEVSETGRIESSEKLEVWLGDNYSQVSFQALQGDAADRLFEIVMSTKNAVLVIGDEGRSSISKFFRPSAKDNIVKFANLPVFIAHQ